LLPENCTSLSGPPAPVQVVPRQVTRVTITFQCVARYGTLQVFVATSGQDPDHSGFLVSGTGFNGRALPNELLSFQQATGQFTVMLTDVAPNCRLLSPATQEVELRAGTVVRDIVQIRFEVECVRTEKLAFVEGDLIVVSYVDGSEPTALSPGSDPDWAPNGALVFHGRSCPWFTGLPLANYSGDWPPPEPCVEHGIWVASGPPRSQARVLTTDPKDMHPVWRPDGQVIAFERQGVLQLIRADGTDHTTLLTPGVLWASMPSWAPDGTRLVFTCEVEPGNLDLCMIQPNGAGFQRLTTTAGPDSEPDWGPEGRIAFTTQRYTGRNDVALLNPSDGSIVRLEAGRSPAWSPEGARLAWTVDGLGIAIAHLDGSSFRFINHQAGHAPAWRP
jgi:hypothetical protein